MSTVRRIARRWTWLASAALVFLFVGVLWAANVVTDGTMELNPTVNWTHADIVGTSTVTKATDQKGGGSFSLKNVSAGGKRILFDWADRQSVGSIAAGSVVTLSLWYGTQATAATTASLSVEVSTDGTNWTPIWSAAPTAGTTFAAATVAATDVSSFFATTTTYQLRLRASGQTANTAGATVSVWWDNVVLDVTAPAPTATTIGDGTDPANVTRVCPGEVAQSIDAFTLQSNRTSAITGVNVAFASGTSAGIALVEITNDTGNAIYGSLANPASDNTSVSVVMSSTVTLTQFRIRVTPKAATAMPGVPGAAYPVTARVTGLTSDAASVSGTDTDSATVTIDNLSPSNATWSPATAGDGYVDLAWLNPADADFQQVVILRNTTTPIIDSPVEGQTYTVPTTVGSSSVVYAGNLQAWRDSTVSNGQSYYYKVFAKDSCGNYATGVESGPWQPVGVPRVTTVGDGTDPANIALCPGDAATMADAFTLQTAVGTDTITAVTVSLTAGTESSLSRIEITNESGSQVSGSALNPSASVVTVPLTTSIIANTTLTQYRVRITPKAHSAMPSNTAVPYQVAATVTGVACNDSVLYQDADSGIVTIDNAAPSAASWRTNTPGDMQVTLNWNNPSDPDFAEVVILRSTTAGATTPVAEGVAYVNGQTLGSSTVCYVGNAATAPDTGLTNGVTYYYRIFARDTCGNYSGVTESPGVVPLDVVPRVGAGTGSATVDSCTQVTVRVPFTGDKPVGNSSVTVERSGAVGGPWTPICANVTGASPRTCVAGSLTAATTYYFRVTFDDADGVTGQNPQIVGPVTTPAVCLASPTTAGTATAAVNACRQVTVTAPFSGDGDNDGFVKVEYNTTNTWPGTTSCATLTGGTPRSCIVSGLNGGTSYYFRATYSDPDGVTGTSQQVIGPLVTTACGADTAAPMVMFLSPARDAIIGGNERFKVQVHDAVALAATTPVQFSLDGGSSSATGVALNANYNCGPRCAIYEFTVATDPLANGPHYVTVRATDTSANVATASQPFIVNNRFNMPFGTGTLLRRTHSSQLCIDCHALGGHSSQLSASTTYGNWGMDCVTCHTPHGTSNIGLVRSTIRTPNSGLQSVDFRALDKVTDANPQYAELGAYDVTGAPFNDGICEVCHTKTLHYRNDNSGGDHSHYRGTRCTNCHSHTSGFKAEACNDCHAAPPAVGPHRRHDEVWDSTSGNLPSSYGDTAQHGTATQYGYVCSNCHGGTHKNDAAVNPAHNGSATAPWLVEVIFRGLSVAAPWNGTYSGTYNQATDQQTYYFSTSAGTCSNTYCHSNANPVSGTNAAVPVLWNATATTCSSCHKSGGFGDTGFDATALSKSHNTHVQSSSGETNTYTFKCYECHATVMNANATSAWTLASADLRDKRLHVDEEKSVAFATIGTANQSAGTYDSNARTCGNTYCHSQGTSTTSFVAPNVIVAWNSTAGCATCHSGNAAASGIMATGKHAEHVNNAATYGVNLTCEGCHNAVVSGDLTVTDRTLHVNGSAQVAGTWVGTWAKPTCASSRCHSNGQRLGTPEYYSMSWTSGATDCKGCHGRANTPAFASVAGEPNYATNAGASSYNSHKAHVSAATDCKTCHAATVGTSLKIDGTTPSRHLDIDGTPDIVYSADYSSATYNATNRTCSVSCHGSGTPAWGGAALVCADCHFGAADTDNWNISDRVPSIINSTEWTTTGHGTAAIALPGTNPCLYCHTTSVGHYDPANPFRLANYNATNDGANSTCFICHKTGSVGYNPGAGVKNGAKKIDSYHYGTKHGTTNTGGRVCWDCHDPHGDGNIKMVGKTAVKTSNDAWSLSATRTTQVTFTSNAAASGYVSQGAAIVATGVCNVCHVTAGHYKSTSGDGHYSGTVCTSCHAHSQAVATDAFKNAGGGNCIGCHGDASGAPARRAVTADFADGTTPNFRSHHVGSGTANALKGTLTNFDCVVCHAEGKVTAGATDTTGQPHMDGKIDLRNVDSATAYFTYDKDAIKASASTTLSQWSSANAVWRTQTSTALDPFCLTCHDADGATQAPALSNATATAMNPFADTAIANNYDQLVRPGPIDIKSKVSGSPPAQGTFSRHAIRGQSTSVYTTYTGVLTGCNGTSACKPIFDYGLFVQNGTDENGKPNWNDTSVMGCADCHTSDGAGGTAGNAHGSASEYMLKDASGGATEGTLANLSYVCFRCHTKDTAITGNYTAGGTHANNGGDYQDYTGQVGANRVPIGNTGGSRFGMACTNCHGGGPSHSTATPGTDGFGWIHGTNQTFYVGYTTTTRNAYRFMNGGSMRFWDPNGWNTGSGSCYTLGGATRGADQWGGCTKHTNAGAYTRKVFRPLAY